MRPTMAAWAPCLIYEVLVLAKRVSAYSWGAYHRLGHGFADARAAAGTEEDLSLEEVLVEDCGGGDRRRLDVALGGHD